MLVSIRRVDSYDDAALYAAVSQHFEALNVANDLHSGTRVLLKANLLTARDPSQAVTTHPALMRAVALWLREHGVTDITLADSPGGLYTTAALGKVYAACGLNALADVLKLNTDVTFERRDGFELIRPVLDADYIIDCAKLKTHGLTIMTGAVKNLFGCLPGLKKPEIHCVKPNIDAFAEFLLDLAEAVKPQLTIVDAIDCMEGNGPGGGTVRHMGYTIASRSPYAADEAGAALMALRPAMSPVLRHARQRGLCDPKELEYIGDELCPAEPPFTLPDSVTKGESLLTAKGLFHRICGRRKALPVVRMDKCVGCGRCAESCPKKSCIACFCCQEMCPAHAIDVQ